MPWKECHGEDERLLFRARLLAGEAMTVLCTEHAINDGTPLVTADGAGTGNDRAPGRATEPAGADVAILARRRASWAA